MIWYLIIFTLEVHWNSEFGKCLDIEFYIKISWMLVIPCFFPQTIQNLLNFLRNELQSFLGIQNMFSVCVDFVCFTYFSYLLKYFILTLKRYVCKIESNIVTLSTNRKKLELLFINSNVYPYYYRCRNLTLKSNASQIPYTNSMLRSN